jgi:dihydroflavonol-4-reductase
MAVFVTGATDVVGANLVRTLTRGGETVRVLLRNNDRYNDVLKDLPAERTYGDPTDTNALRRAIKDCTAVYHTEELNPVEYCPPEAYHAVNAEGTRRVLQVALEREIPRVIYTSSAFTVGCGTSDTLAVETTEFNLAHLEDPYIESKRKAESIASEFLSKGLEVVILNPGLVLGPMSIRPTIGTALVRLTGTLTKLYPSGGILVSDAEDVARAHIVAMERGIPGERYIVGTENTKYFLLLELLYTISGFHPVSIPLPRFSAFLMGWLSDTFAKAFGKAIPSIPSLSVVKRTYLDLFLSSEKATLELGMTWTSLKETLEKTVDWLRKNRML